MWIGLGFALSLAQCEARSVLGTVAATAEPDQVERELFLCPREENIGGWVGLSTRPDIGDDQCALTLEFRFHHCRTNPINLLEKIFAECKANPSECELPADTLLDPEEILYNDTYTLQPSESQVAKFAQTMDAIFKENGLSEISKDRPFDVGLQAYISAPNGKRIQARIRMLTAVHYSEQCREQGWAENIHAHNPLRHFLTNLIEKLKHNGCEPILIENWSR